MAAKTTQASLAGQIALPKVIQLPRAEAPQINHLAPIRFRGLVS